MQKKTAIYSAAVILIALALSTLIRTGLSNSVKTTKVVRDTAIDAVPAIINVRSDYTFTLSSKERGRVIKSALSLGTTIKEGDLVLEIDPTDLQIDADILKADIENLKARLALKSAEDAELRKQEEDLKNYERLYAAGSYPELEMQRRRRDFKVFTESQKRAELNEAQQLNTLKNQLTLVERRLEKTKVYAPTDGIVTQIYAYPGELINSGSPLAEVFSKAVVIEAKINEEDFAGIKSDLNATVRLLTYGNRLFEGKVDRVLPTTDKETQQYTALLELDINRKLLMPGLSGEASIIRRRVPDALIIPSRALIGDFVFKIVDHKAVFTPIKVGVRGLKNVEIKEGLSEGDIIIVDGMDELKDGDAVRF
tara:strand:+ start:2105 stop:3205 length:1101 start_codon:yes stop_codon:yes gene_type:complete